MEEIQIEVYGRVQGVNFRNTIKEFADNSSLKGFVRNLEDGSVIIVAQGDKKKLLALKDWVEQSPGFSKIDGMSFRWKEHSIDYKEFSVVKEGGYIADKAKAIVNLGKHLVGASTSPEKIPVHIAIIPDGNRRWAKDKGLIGSMGHYKSGSKENIDSIVIEAQKSGVKYLSFWGFSTENWSRDSQEVNAIFDLVKKILEGLIRDAKKNNIRFRHMGRRDRLPPKLLEIIEKAEKETRENSNLNIQIFLDYGGRDEILRAVNTMIKKGVKKVDEKTFSDYLDTAGIPDPDLIIRTSGEKRTSGLMPFQSVYAEFYFTDIHFPDFDGRELRKAIEDFGKRDRRFGGNTKK